MLWFQLNSLKMAGKILAWGKYLRTFKILGANSKYNKEIV